MFSFIKASLIGFVLSVSGLSNAGLIDMGSITHDDNTGLDWLDLSETYGMSFDEVTTQLGIGGTLEGYRYATLLEIEGFLTEAGGSGDYLGSDYNTEVLGGWVTSLMGIWGDNSDWNGRNDLEFVIWGNPTYVRTFYKEITTTPKRRPDGSILRRWDGTIVYETIPVFKNVLKVEVGLLQNYASAGYDTVRFGVDHYIKRLQDDGRRGVGSALVRAEVPEPSTLAIFALGMMGLASRRFKQQS
jgi:hypothetical protein